MTQELYRKLYANLCGEVSEAIDLLKDPGNILYVRSLLQKALWDGEERYIQSETCSKSSHTKE